MVAPAGVRNSEGCYVMADTIIMRGAYAIPICASGHPA